MNDEEKKVQKALGLLTAYRCYVPDLGRDSRRNLFSIKVEATSLKDAAVQARNYFRTLPQEQQADIHACALWVRRIKTREEWIFRQFFNIFKLTPSGEITNAVTKITNNE